MLKSEKVSSTSADYAVSRRETRYELSTSLNSETISYRSSGGAFTDTGLDQQLRRRGIKTLVLGGLVTNFGVESTARAARDLGYDVVFAEDAMSTVSAEMHRFAVGQIFPYLGRVRTSSEIAEGLA